MNPYAAIYTDHLHVLHERLASLRAQPQTKRTAALIAQYEQCVLDCEECMELGAEMAEVACEADAEAVEVSSALDAAILDAQATGCAMVKGAPALMREMARLVPGCTMQRGQLEIATVATDGGELRLVRRAGSYRAALSWRAA